ncbi:MAG: phosphate signaling complex protein PhoU [Actinomycetota bacterium]
MTDPATHHIQEGEIELRHHFDDELDDIRSHLVEMGTMVVSNTKHATVVLTENRLDEIDSVIDADEPINEMYSETEAHVFQVLALQQPVASDLRFLVATTRILYELERTGDLAVNLVKALRRIDGIPTESGLQTMVARLGEASAAMFSRGIEAIASMDAGIGERADQEDELVDNLTEDLFTLVTERQERLGLDVSVALFRIGRFYERIADHGVNIAQNVTFMVTSVMPEDQ